MVKLAFKVMAIFWITSPITFVVMRVAHIFDYKGIDWLIFLGFCFMSSLTMFLTYKRS